MKVFDRVGFVTGTIRNGRAKLGLKEGVIVEIVGENKVVIKSKRTYTVPVQYVYCDENSEQMNQAIKNFILEN